MELEKLYRELDKLNEDYKIIEESCLNKGMDWAECCKETKPLKLKIFEINRKIRNLKEPELTYGRKWKGEVYTLEKFKELVNSGNIVDGDGCGYYMSETAKSNVEILPSDILYNEYRTDFDYVLWLNK